MRPNKTKIKNTKKRLAELKKEFNTCQQQYKRSKKVIETKKMILENMAGVIIVYNLNSLVIEWMSKKEGIHGLNHGQYLTKTKDWFFEQIHPDDLHFRKNFIVELKTIGKACFIYRYLNCNNDYQWCFESATVLSKTPEGNPRKTLSIQLPLADFTFSSESATALLSELNAIKHQTKINLLTKRENELIQNLATKDTLAMIAKEMKISKQTVEIHIKRIKKKLGISNQAELVNFAVEAIPKA